MKSTIVIADDHPVTAEGMKSVLERNQIEVIGIYTNGVHALNKILTSRPDYALLDMQMPGLSGIDILEKIKTTNIKTKVIIYTMYKDLALFQKSVELGVEGYLLKEFALSDLKTCINSLRKEEKWFNPQLEQKLEANNQAFSPVLYQNLTSTEKIIAKHISQNKSTKTIANELFVSEKTIESHRRNIVKKLELPGKRNVLLVWAIENRDFFSMLD